MLRIIIWHLMALALTANAMKKIQGNVLQGFTSGTVNDKINTWILTLVYTVNPWIRSRLVTRRHPNSVLPPDFSSDWRNLSMKHLYFQRFNESKQLVTERFFVSGFRFLFGIGSARENHSYQVEAKKSKRSNIAKTDVGVFTWRIWYKVCLTEGY